MNTETLIKSEKLHHVIESQQFDIPLINEVFERTNEMEETLKKGGDDLLSGKILCSLFYEESTRTRFSFETAMKRLGGQVISTENAKQFSSSAKGESLRHTIQVISGSACPYCRYADVIVLRHYEAGSAELAAEYSGVPLISAGDGPEQHPTQALLDLYTIYREKGSIDGLSIALVGDLANGRTVRSICYLLGKYDNIMIYLVAPKIVQMKNDVKAYLKRHNVFFTEEHDLRKVAPKVDIIYQTRLQLNRIKNKQELKAIKSEIKRGFYFVDENIIDIKKEGCKIMHPMPIDEEEKEIRTEIEDHPDVIFLEQAGLGVPLRMALLAMILE